MKAKRRLAIFASGAGSNARQLMQYFEGHDFIEIACVVCNREGAGVLQIANEFQVPIIQITRADFQNVSQLIHALESHIVSDIVLAGFLWKIPVDLVNSFQHRIYNIHPSLLPKFGGKGMYGHFVHEAVFHSGDHESGITIHYVNEFYDQGDIIAQYKVDISQLNSPNEIELAVRELEKKFFPFTIERVLQSQ
jgi:phosphoribosylglycinamide formyltransferase-1